MKALVLAGGRGTRLGELTGRLAKPMLPVGGRPFLEYLLDRLAAGGVEEFILSLHYLPDTVRRHFGSRYQGVAIRYAVEPEALGTGGAIAYALRGEPAGPVLALNGDSFLDIDYAALMAWYRRDPAPVALVVRPIADAGRYGTVAVEGGHAVSFAEKRSAPGPALISAGVYILQPGVFDRFGLAGRFSIETDLLQRHCAALRPRAYRCDGYFIDIGVAGDLERAQHELPAMVG